MSPVPWWARLLGLRDPHWTGHRGDRPQDPGAGAPPSPMRGAPSTPGRPAPAPGRFDWARYERELSQ